MQVHKSFTTEQVRRFFKGYCQGMIERKAVEDMPGIEKTRFFTLLEHYRNNQEWFSLAYRRKNVKRLHGSVEKEIEHALKEEKCLFDDPELPITGTTIRQYEIVS